MVRKYFGTDGIRGKANEGAMTAETALRVGMAAFSRVLVKWPPPPILPVSVVIMSCPYAPR